MTTPVEPDLNELLDPLYLPPPPPPAVLFDRELAMPFYIDSNGSVGTITDRSDILMAHVMSVLGTAPTARGMRPTYGCNLAQFAFRNHDNSTDLRDEMTVVVREAMARFCPEAVFVELRVARPTDQGLMRVTVFFLDPDDPNNATQLLRLGIQTDGGVVIEKGTS